MKRPSQIIYEAEEAVIPVIDLIRIGVQRIWLDFQLRTLITPLAPDLPTMVIKKATIKGIWK